MTGPLIPLGDDGAACQDGFCELPAPAAPAKVPTKTRAQNDSAEAGQDNAREDETAQGTARR